MPEEKKKEKKKEKPKFIPVSELKVSRKMRKKTQT